MKSAIRFAIPAVFAFAAVSVQAQTIETDYPRAVPAGPVVATDAPAISVTKEFAQGNEGVFLVQSNSEGPRVDPGYAVANESRLTRDEVQAQARVRVQWNAPDRRS